jgi:hypothetical protein
MTGRLPELADPPTAILASGSRVIGVLSAAGRTGPGLPGSSVSGAGPHVLAADADLNSRERKPTRPPPPAAGDSRPGRRAVRRADGGALSRGVSYRDAGRHARDVGTYIALEGR